jgi:aminoglycoside phosphotransferase (APT) family kinase protein
VRDDEDRVWRTYLFIEGARTFDLIESETQAEAAARAFGAFQQLLADLPGQRLHETIPGFHHTPGRFAACVAAIDADVINRASGARDAIDFTLARSGDVTRLVDAHARGDLPERITHNDTKLNNVMLDLATGEGLCVIDLDTTMPGLAPYDFGDMVRTATNSAAEDEPDVSKVTSRAGMFDALARGYLSAAGPLLTPGEVEHLAFAGKLMTFECGIRFLADHLQGDIYFRTHRPGQNLDRARVQFALVTSMERQMETFERLVRSYWGQV